MSRAVEVLAPAKLTRSLRILGTRPDGYHLIEAEMVSLDWGDSLLIDPDGTGLEIEDRTPWAGGPTALRLDAGEDNLVARALAATGRPAGVRLTKRVPTGAGLGGGSSDAAAILRWAGVETDAEGLTLACLLGADVPFCLAGGRALVRGIGEQVQPLDPVNLSLTLLLVPLACPTAAVYAAWDRSPGRSSGTNDLEPAALTVEPGLARWREAWGAATGLEPHLAGSGSTWFVEEARPELTGPFPDPDGSGPDGWVVITRTGRP
jgi:4-diphosphocytidyl-2-C-methyl-D-erythritol kinase